MSLKKWRKKMKKTFAFKAIKTAGRTSAKIVKYAAPVVGAVIAGPLGAAAGAALSGAASQVGPNKNRGAALKRALIYGGAVTGGAAALSVLGGTSLTTGALTSVSRIFSPGSAPPGANVQSDPFAGQDVMLTGTPDNSGLQGSGNTLNTLADAFLGGGGPAVPGNQAGGNETQGRTGGSDLSGPGGDTREGAEAGMFGFQGRGLLVGVVVIVIILVIISAAGKKRAAA